jgi:DNA-binding response OmpR family regulator
VSRTEERRAPRILVVEDEAHLAEGLAFNLAQEGLAVEVVGDGESAVQRIAASPGVDCVILDLMLPGLGGLEVARRVRAAGNYVPILILTAKDDPGDLVRGIEEGADDYLTKPFRIDEVLVRVRGLLRRRRWDGARGDEGPRELRLGDATVHFDRLEIETPRGTIRLTTREAALLRALVEREGQAVPRGELLETVWGLRPDTQTRVVDSFVVRLRRYLEPDPSRPRHIVSVRGHGYRFVR